MKLIKRVLQEELWGYLTPALMMGMDETIIDRIAFGGVGEGHEETTCQQAPNPFLYGTGR
jgi:hypothetical protein